jgi:hypothetical protein
MCVQLISHGVSEFTIELCPQASPSERWAAEELASHLEQMSGTRLKVRECVDIPAKAVILGFGPATESLGVETDDSLGEEGYLIKTINGRLVIAGSKMRGTLYGVYTLLEKLGVRWWTPTESTIPVQKTILLPELDLREIPRLAYRDMMYFEVFTDEGKLWMARNKLNGMSWSSGPGQEKLGGRYEHVGKHFLHGSTDLLKSSGVAIKDEMWSMVDGKRLPDSQPCFTNPEVIAAVAGSVVYELRNHPRAKFVAVAHEEAPFGYCRCEKCSELVLAEGPSGLMIQFANQVAAMVDKEIPGGRIATGAYHWSCNPPKNIKPHHNVVIAYDPLSCDYSRPLSSRKDDDANIENDETPGDHHVYRVGEHKRNRREIEGWGKISRNLILYDYTACTEHPCMPYPNLDVLVPNIRYYAECGFSGIFTLGSLVNRGSEFYGLRMWLLAKALWNPMLDGKMLINEFLNGYYGSAAPAIQKYIDIIHQTPRRRENCYLPFWGNLLNSVFVRPEIIAAAEQSLREADRLADGNSILESRVRHAHMPIWWILAKRGPQSLTWKLTESKVGRLDLQQLADNFRKVANERGRPEKPDGELGPPFTDWLSDYAKLVSERKEVIPSELMTVDREKMRVIQACQMDRPASFWKITEGASDGWALVLEKALPVLQRGTASAEPLRGLSPGEDYLPGKKYKIFARIKGEGKCKEGVACICGVSGVFEGEVDHHLKIPAWQMVMGLSIEDSRKQKMIRKNIPAGSLADGQFKVFEIAEVINPTLLTFNLPDGVPVMERVFLDCFWLVEVC